jgi:hypothetical protein
MLHPTDTRRTLTDPRTLHPSDPRGTLTDPRQNLCHNKSTQHMAPQRSDLALCGGGMTYMVYLQTGFPNKYFLLI